MDAYLGLHEDVRLSGLNPIDHYLRYGNREGRLVSHTRGFTYRPVSRRGKLNTLASMARVVFREPRMLISFAREAYRGGLARAIEVTAFKLTLSERPLEQAPVAPVVSVAAPAVGEVIESRSAAACQVVPYYLDPYLEDAPEVGAKRIAVHLHLSDGGFISHYAARLSNIPQVFDLYVSLPEDLDAAACRRDLESALKNLGKLHIEKVPDRGGATAPLIACFGKYLSGLRLHRSFPHAPDAG